MACHRDRWTSVDLVIQVIKNPVLLGSEIGDQGSGDISQVCPLPIPILLRSLPPRTYGLLFWRAGGNFLIFHFAKGVYLVEVPSILSPRTLILMSCSPYTGTSCYHHTHLVQMLSLGQGCFPSNAPAALTLAKGPFPLAQGPIFGQAACLPQPRVAYSGGGNALLLSQDFFLIIFIIILFLFFW